MPPSRALLAARMYLLVSRGSTLRRGVVIVVSVIDNLVKGAAGQAIQNMNLMMGLDEGMGLRYGVMYP